MTLTDDDVKHKIRTNPNKLFIDFLTNKYNVMRAHATGIGAKDLIQKLEGFERKNIMDARKRLMLSNKDVLARVMKPRNKIYTAKGGIESYNLATSELIQEWKEYLSKCAGKRTSLKEYISQKIQKAFDIDPMGLKWVALNEDGEPYPTYKCITNIYDYEINDGTPEYVVFKCTDKEISSYVNMGLIAKPENANPKIYRVVCDTYDRIVTWYNDIEIKVQYLNPFEVVPGEVISDIICEDEKGCEYRESDLYEVTELLSQMVFARSIYNIAYSQTAYPLMWMQALPCPTCHGKKVISNVLNGDMPRAQQGDMTCPECKGSGVYPHFQNSDTYIWEFSKDINKSVPTPPLGIIETAIENLQYMKDEKIDIETLITETQWGVAKVFPNTKVPKDGSKGSGNTSETAFESALNEQPKYDRLKTYSKWLANTMKWYADTMGKVKYGDAYISSAILCGDRYAVESPDEILTRITKAKAGGAAQAILESLQMEYLESKYENNPLELRKAKIYYIGEPYFFFAVADVDAWADIPQIQKLEKKMWGEFMCTLTDQDIAAIPDDGMVPAIQKLVRDYVMGKFIADKATDALLFANDGSQLMIGDNARVKAMMAKDPKHLSRTFKVSNVTAEEVTLDAEDGETISYKRSELERIIS